MIQLDRLKDVLARAAAAPYYKGRLPTPSNLTESMWKEIPFTTKKDLRASYPFGFLAVPKRQLATYHETSGTTGEPTPSFFTAADWEDVASRFGRNAVNIQPGESVMVKTPYSMATSAHQAHLGAQLRNAFVIPADNRSSIMSYPKVLRLLSGVPVNVAWCLPTEALLWARAAELTGREPATGFPELRAFLVAGELLGEAKRNFISRLWGGKKVFQDYGSTETGSLAGEGTDGKLHLWTDRLFCEVFNPATGETTETGRGQLVVTPLFREAMPLVRYLIGDFVELVGPTITIQGRPEDVFIVGKKTISVGEIEEIIYSAPDLKKSLFYNVHYDSDSLDVILDGVEAHFSSVGEYIRDSIFESFGISVNVSAANGRLISREKLLEETPFAKPRFAFHKQSKENQKCYQQLC